MRYILNKKLTLVSFFDAGLIYDDASQGSWDHLKYGYGVGVRYFTNVIPIRFDLAWGEDFILHFNISNMF